MYAADFSSDVLEMFYGVIFPQEGLPEPIRPNTRLGFEIARNEFNDFSGDVLEMFYGENFPQEGLPEPIRPNI